MDEACQSGGGFDVGALNVRFHGASGNKNCCLADFSVRGGGCIEGISFSLEVSVCIEREINTVCGASCTIKLVIKTF
jgi:hypothetical protein